MFDKVDFFVWSRHYHDHAMPIWKRLPSDKKGNYYISTHLHNRNEFYLPESKKERVIIYNNLSAAIKDLKCNKRLLVVFGVDKKIFNALNRAFVLISHGVGQTYEENNIYIPYHEKCLLYILPNRIIENVYKRNYPQVKTFVAGCPKLDYWHTHPAKPKEGKPVITISFHFDNNMVPETRTAFPYFKQALEELASQKKWKVLGHGHPRIIDELTPYYQELGIEVVRDFNEVMRRSDLYICDTSSTLYEFASTGRPVVVLNAPWYRRNIEHGIRFWEHADVGINCNNPEELLQKIEEALLDSPEQKKLREKAVKAVYAVSDGTASQKAINAIISLLASKEYEEYCNKRLASHGAYPGIVALLEQSLEKNKYKSKIVIFGGSEHTKRLLEVIGRKYFNIIGIVDNDFNKHGSYILGYRVFSPNKISELNPDVIIISSFEHEKEIYGQLISLYSKNNIRLYSLYKDNSYFKEDIFRELYFRV